jgi:membrane protein implicated in regulation of membrane protease activity
VSRASRRLFRSSVLGLAALGVLVWAAVDQFDIPVEKMAELFLGTLWVAGGIIIFAALLVVVLVGLRKLLQRSDSE